MIKPKVVNIKTNPYTLYIGRGSKWGNPFSIGPHGFRQKVVALFEEYARSELGFSKEDLKELTGQVLGCYCKPKECHGDILVKLWEEAQDDC